MPELPADPNGVADPQKQRRPRERPTLGLFLARLEADVRSIGLAAELARRGLSHPGLVRLGLHLAVAYPPGSAHGLAREAGDAIFGETPLATAWRILGDAGVRPGERLTELGCGPGRLSLVAASQFQMRCEALDRVQSFVDRGNRLARRLKLDVAFRTAELLHWKPASEQWVYVAGTAFSAKLRGALAAALESSRASVISVSSPLRIVGHTTRLLGTYRFPWGREDVYIESTSVNP